MGPTTTSSSGRLWFWSLRRPPVRASLPDGSTAADIAAWLRSSNCFDPPVLQDHASPAR